MSDDSPFFVFDENLSEQLAAGMRAFGEDADHTRNHWAQGTKDPQLLPEVGKRGWILVTRDAKQRRRPAELAAYKEHGLGVFYLGGKNLGRCDIIRQVVRNWHTMKELAAKTPKPFAYRVPPQGTSIDTVPL